MKLKLGRFRKKEKMKSESPRNIYYRLFDFCLFTSFKNCNYVKNLNKQQLIKKITKRIGKDKERKKLLNVGAKRMT